MTIMLVMRYAENRDSTSITFKKYNLSPQDKYPTFSICFEGSEFQFYHDLNLFNNLGITSSQYKLMLRGEAALRYEYNETSSLYRKTSVFMTNVSHGNIQHFQLQMSDIILRLKFGTENPNNDKYYHKDESSQKQPPFFVGYQTPDMICHTRESKDTLNLKRMHDTLVLKSSIMRKKMYENTIMKIFIHYPGQLIRSLDNPTFKSSFTEYQKEKLLEIKLSQGTLLVKRPDSKDGCNTEIEEHDTYFVLELFKKLGCIPPYLKQNLKMKTEWDECTS